MRRLLLSLVLLGLSWPVLAKDCKVHIARHERHTSAAQKKEAYRRAGIAWGDRHKGKCAQGCVVDHLVPLELGGLDQTSNMQIQTAADGKAKDRVENWLAAEVCAGRISLSGAQRMVVRWRTVKIPVAPPVNSR